MLVVGSEVRQDEGESDTRTGKGHEHEVPTRCSERSVTHQKAEIVVHATGLGKTYPRGRDGKPAQALRDFDLVVAAGEVVLLVGANGAGKSTVLRLISGVERPTRGRIAVFGQPPRSMECRRRVGFLPDGSELFPFLDARETLDFFAAAANLDRSRRRERIAQMIDRFDLGDYGKKRVKAFSAGMRRRLGLACTLIGAPELLLLDEPTTALDPAGQRRFEQVVQDERHRGTAVIMSSHHLGQVQTLADRIVVIDDGRILLSGRAGDIATDVGERELVVGDLDDTGLEKVAELVRRLGGRWGGSRVSERGLENRLLDGAKARANENAQPNARPKTSDDTTSPSAESTS